MMVARVKPLAASAFGTGLATVAGTIFAVLAVRAFLPLAITDYVGHAVAAASIVLIAVAAATLIPVGHPRAERDARFLVPLLVLFVVTRLIWVVWSPTLPFSDFAFYDRLAHELASGGPVTARWPHMGMIAAWGYPVVLAGAYRALGHQLLVAKLFNVALGAVALVALHAFARRIAGRSAARGACVLFVLWPGQLLYSAVLGSENLAVPLLLVALAIVVRVLDDARSSARLALLVLAGVVLAASFSTRSVLAIAVVVVLLGLLLEAGTSWPYRLARCGALLASFTLTFALYLMLLQARAGVMPGGGGSWSLLVGTNVEHRGTWNLPDVETFTSYPDVASANRFARTAAWQRISADPRRFAELAAAKIGCLWDNGADATFWNAESMADSPAAETVRLLRAPTVVVAQSFHVVVLLLGALGILRVARRRQSVGLSVSLVFLLLGTLVHGVLETQPRYNFPMQPVLFVFAAIAVARASEHVKHP